MPINLKTYRAATMGEALAEVKRDLGPAAVILHTRSYKTGAVMGVGGRTIVEITASDQPAPRVRVAPDPSSTPRDPGAAPDRHTAFVGQEFARLEPKESPVVERREARAPLPETTASPAAPAPRTPSTPHALAAARVEPAPVNVAAFESLQSELAGVKRLMAQVLHASHAASARVRAADAPILAGDSDPLFDHYARLLDSGLTHAAASEVLARVRDDLRAHERADPTTVHASLLAHLAKLVTVAPPTPLALRSSDGRPLTIALVGPTGAGKTTTLAKLAAGLRLRQSRRVGVVTCDTYRIAAVDQLRTYASILNVPVKVALTPAELADHLAAFRDLDAVLIDTPGRAHHDTVRLADLRESLRAAQPHETHLALPATLSPRVVERTLHAFAPLAPNRLILTKLDEAVDLGAVVSALRHASIPLSHVTTGQEVPDDIEPASADRLARLVLAGTNARLSITPHRVPPVPCEGIPSQSPPIPACGQPCG